MVLREKENFEHELASQCAYSLSCVAHVLYTVNILITALLSAASFLRHDVSTHRQKTTSATMYFMQKKKLFANFPEPASRRKV